VTDNALVGKHSSGDEHDRFFEHEADRERVEETHVVCHVHARCPANGVPARSRRRSQPKHTTAAPWRGPVSNAYESFGQDEDDRQGNDVPTLQNSTQQAHPVQRAEHVAIFSDDLS